MSDEKVVQQFAERAETRAQLYDVWEEMAKGNEPIDPWQAIALMGLVLTGVEFHLDRIATAFELDEADGEEWKDGRV